MIDKDKEQHWDREMKEVDRLLSKLPTYESGKPGAGGEPTVRRGAAGAAAGPLAGTTAGMWLKVAVGVVLAAGVTGWPYSHVCGLKLFFYLGAALTVATVGAWAAIAAWRRRAGLAHVLALGVLVWGLGLTALTVLPRLGYAPTEALWLCPEPPTQIAPTPR